MHMRMIFRQSQRTTERICLIHMGYVVNYLTRSDEVILQWKMVAMMRLMIIHFEAYVELVMVFAVFILL